MLQVAPPETYQRLLPLVPPSHQAGHMTFVHAVLEGTMPGRILVDDATNANTAIACSVTGFWFALGEPREELVLASMPLLAEALPPTQAELFATTEAWAGALRTAVRPLLNGEYRRNEYHFLGPTAASATVPPGFRLVPLDAQIARLFPGSVDPWVVDIWGGPDLFAERTFGWAVMCGEELASFCTTCAIGGGEAEVEIGTNQAFRHRGLAEIAGAMFVRSCLERGLRPAWTCTTGNKGSERLAEKLGFVKFREVAGFVLRR